VERVTLQGGAQFSVFLESDALTVTLPLSPGPSTPQPEIISKLESVF